MRPVRRSRAACAVLAVPALLLVLSACGGDDLAPVAGESTSETTSSASSGAESSDSPSEAAVPEDAAGESDESADAASGEGTWDEKTIVPAMKDAIEKQETAHFSMSTSSGGMSLSAEGDMAFRGAQQNMAMTMDGSAFGAGDIEMRLVDQVLYLSMPPMTAKGKFVEIRPGDKTSPFAGMAGQMQGVDPRDTFKAFEDGLRKVDFVGEESVAGEDLEHYRLTVDFRAAAKAQGMPRMAGMPRTVAYDMWLDEDALMRRVEFAMAQQMSMVMEMSDWGEPVRITAPSPRQIVEAPGQ